MRQDQLSPAPGSKKDRVRVGRGSGSGHGDYSGKGIKGQKARAGGGVRRGFEGGQLPLIRRLPSQRGFTNIFRQEYQWVNLSLLNDFNSGEEVTPQVLKERRIIKSLRKPIKILGEGEISVPLVIKAHKFSESARSKIVAAGGQAEEIHK